MAVLMRVLCALGALCTITAAEGATSQAERHLRKPGHHKHKHHMRFSKLKDHGASTSDHAKMTPDKEFGAIQKTMIEAWREKAHLDHLQTTLQSQKSLLNAQEKLLSANDDVDEEERKQFLQMYEMVRTSRALSDKIRKSAVKKTRDAMAEVMSINSRADEQLARNKQEIADMQRKIAQDVAANAEANRTKERAKTVLAAAVQEAKYFQNILSQAKTDKQEGRNEEQSMLKLAYELKERKEHEDRQDEAGAESDEKQQTADEKDRDSDGDDRDKQHDDNVARDDEVLTSLKHVINEAN